MSGAVPEPLLESLHNAALDPDRWGDALRECGEFVVGAPSRGLCAVTLYEGPAPGTGWLLAGVDERSERAYPFGAGSRHPLFARAESFEEGFVGESERLADPDDLARSTLARDHLRDDGRIIGTSAVLCTRPFVAAMHVFGRAGAEPWTDGVAERLRALTPAVRRALEVYVRIRHQRALSLIDQALLDRLDVAALTLSPSGALLRANERARATLDEGDALTLSEGRLRCARDAADAALRDALLRVQAGGERHAVVIAPRRSGRRPLLLFVGTVRERDDGAVRAVTVLARDAAPSSPHVEDVLRQVFSLSPAEARIAVQISEGRGPAEVAELLGISVLTARTHLKRIFDKTATTKQSELVRLVFAELPPLKPA